MLHKNPDDLTKEEKIILGLDIIKQFFDSLGPTDIYKQIVLEEVMRVLIGDEHESSLYLPNSTGPKGHENNNHP